MPIIGYVLGGLFALGGCWFGIKTWKQDISPAALWFMSGNAIVDNVVSSVLIWMFRFFSFGLSLVGFIGGAL
ncbi:MAG: hypothetical protein MJZ79_04025 [Paludibacteraceae bacterium]|nr:hypothetical protein [Paludibacteraceae bacterium]